MDLCSIVSLDGIHVYLKPPFEITPLKFLAWYGKLLFCNDPRANWILDGMTNSFKVGFSGQLTICMLIRICIPLVLIPKWLMIIY